MAVCVCPNGCGAPVAELSMLVVTISGAGGWVRSSYCDLAGRVHLGRCRALRAYPQALGLPVPCLPCTRFPYDDMSSTFTCSAPQSNVNTQDYIVTMCPAGPFQP